MPGVLAPPLVEEQRMPAQLADVFTMAVADSCRAVTMTGKEAGDDMTDAGVRAVLSKNRQPAEAVFFRQVG